MSSAAAMASADTSARSAPSALAARPAESALEAATATRRPPAARTAWAWTRPMNPVPAIATRS